MARDDEIQPAVLTLRQASDYLCINQPEVRRLLRDGLIACYRSTGGKEWRIPRSACDEYIEASLEWFEEHREAPGGGESSAG